MLSSRMVASVVPKNYILLCSVNCASDKMETEYLTLSPLSILIEFIMGCSL